MAVPAPAVIPEEEHAMSTYLMPMLLLAPAALAAPGSGGRPPEHTPAGVVCNIKVLSDKVPDVSSIDAWARSFLKPGMTARDKALAAWRSTVMFQHQDNPPREYLQHEDVVQDPIKIFNVYGYSFCSVACCDVAALARRAGLKVRGWGINAHSVPEVYYDGAWHLLDASLINYFPKTDGTLASVEEIMAAIKEWYDRHPGYKGNRARLEDAQRADGWTGWKRGPELLARSPFYDAGGFWPAKTHGWSSTMQEYDGTLGKSGKPFLYEYGYAQGYRVNLQLRPGERLTRNWSNKGLHVNGKGGAPGCLSGRTGAGPLVYTPQFGDLAPGRVGNGVLEYNVPLAGGAFRSAALEVENLQDRAVRLKDTKRPGRLVLRLPSSYVYLAGALTFTAAVGAGGEVAVWFSDNNGLDWRELTRVAEAGERRVDLTPHVLRRYDYRLKFEFRGAGTGLDALRLVHDVQHSQRALPALGQGQNTITFSAGPAEGTVTVEGATNLAHKGKQLVYTDFHPEVRGFGPPNLFIGPSGKGQITFPVATPGDMVRLRFGAHYRARDPRDGLDYQVSFDGGKTWRAVARAAGPTAGDCKYVVHSDVPAGTRAALVRFAGTNRNATGILNFRIDADYREPRGGFRPVRVTYTWEEDGQARQHVHVAHKPQERYTIPCQGRPVMKAITLELAE
jgi:hypothetical protein